MSGDSDSNVRPRPRSLSFHGGSVGSGQGGGPGEASNDAQHRSLSFHGGSVGSGQGGVPGEASNDGEHPLDAVRSYPEYRAMYFAEAELRRLADRNVANARVTINEMTGDMDIFRAELDEVGGLLDEERGRREEAEGDRLQSDAELGEAIYEQGVTERANEQLDIALTNTNVALHLCQQELLESLHANELLGADNDHLEIAAAQWEQSYRMQTAKVVFLKAAFWEDLPNMAKVLSCVKCKKMTGTAVVCGVCSVPAHQCDWCVFWGLYWNFTDSELESAAFKDTLARLPRVQWGLDNLNVGDAEATSQLQASIMEEDAKAGGNFFAARGVGLETKVGILCGCQRVHLERVEVFTDQQMGILLAKNQQLPAPRPLVIKGENVYLA